MKNLITAARHCLSGNGTASGRLRSGLFVVEANTIFVYAPYKSINFI